MAALSLLRKWQSRTALFGVAWATKTETGEKTIRLYSIILNVSTGYLCVRNSDTEERLNAKKHTNVFYIFKNVLFLLKLKVDKTVLCFCFLFTQIKQMWNYLKLSWRKLFMDVNGKGYFDWTRIWEPAESVAFQTACTVNLSHSAFQMSCSIHLSPPVSAAALWLAFPQASSSISPAEEWVCVGGSWGKLAKCFNRKPDRVFASGAAIGNSFHYSLCQPDRGWASTTDSESTVGGKLILIAALSLRLPLNTRHSLLPDQFAFTLRRWAVASGFSPGAPTCAFFADVWQVVVAGNVVPLAVLMSDGHHAVLPTSKEVIRLVLPPVLIHLQKHWRWHGDTRKLWLHLPPFCIRFCIDVHSTVTDLYT